MPCCAVLSSAVLCCAILYRAMLCCNMQRYTIPQGVIRDLTIVTCVMEYWYQKVCDECEMKISESM
jgi:hypothetical protein